MKKLKLLLAGLFVTLIASSQAGQLNQINIVNFTVKNTLPATVDSWLSTPGALVLTAQRVPSAQVKEPMMLLQVRSGGAIVCGNNMATAKRVDPFDVRVFNTSELTALLGNCKELKAGSYTICVQFFNIDKVAISREVCKEFKVEETNVEYAPPTLITPDNEKKFTAKELQGVVMFRWTPLVPKPKEPVTYRLKVWQLMQGQNSTQAMRTNQPIVTKDVDNITQAAVNSILTGPCKPPYLCDFIWNVQALNRSGKPMGNNNGTSEPYTFSAVEEKTKGPDNVFPENEKKFNPADVKQAITLRWTPIVPKPQEPVTYRLKVWQLMQGQNSTEAMRTNPPIVTKDVDNITQAIVSGIYTGPCKPPYLCDYIWMVEAVTQQAGATPKIIGTSEATTFRVTEETGKCPANLFPEDKKQFTSEEAKKEMLFRWTTVVPKPQEPVTYRLKVWQLMQGQNGTTAMRTNKPIVTKDVADITEATINGIYTGPCRPPYLCDYIWIVEAVSKDGSTGCIGEPSTFSVTDGNVKCPANLFPEDKKKFTPEEAKKEMLFRWTPIVPKPQEPVTYRLKVWQLMQGQSGSQAMRTNQPIVTKDVDNVTEATVSGIYTGPCRPPYLCDYIWMVEAVSKNGSTTCAGEPTTFSVTDGNVKCPANLFPEDKKKFTPEEAKKEMLFRWTPVVPKPQEPVTYRLKVWQLMQGQNGTTAMRTNKPIVTKDVADITEATINGIYTGPCRPPYLCDYVWSVEIMDAAGRVSCTSEGTSFSIKEESQQQCPVNTFPENNKKLSPAEAKQSIQFKWTNTATPGTTIKYRLKVWQLMQGQSGSQAMKTNNPIVTKDVADISEATVAGIYTGPCRPPYLCDFVWNVETINERGEAGCNSEPSVFKIAGNDIDIQIDSVYVSCCNTNGTQNVYIKIKNNLANTVKITQLNIDKVNGVTNVISITGLTPVLPVNITGLASQVFTGTIKCIDTAKTIRFFVRAEDALDNAITETEVETDTLDCPCEPCRYMTVVVTKDSLTLPKNGNPMQVNLIGSFAGLNPNQVKKVTAEIIYFNITQTKDTNCAKCVFDSKYYGNFYPPASALPGYTGPVFNKPDYSRLVTWNSTIIKDCGGQPHDNGGGVDNGNPADVKALSVDRQTPKRDFGDKMAVPVIGNPQPAPLQPNFILPIAVPEMNSLSCCGDVIKICIRYTFYDFCCHACEVIKCYEIKREK
jgi:hypothetical protein